MCSKIIPNFVWVVGSLVWLNRVFMVLLGRQYGDVVLFPSRTISARRAPLGIKQRCLPSMLTANSQLWRRIRVLTL